MRGEDYVSVLSGTSYVEKTRIKLANGPGMTIFSPDGKYGYVCSSFTPETTVVTVADHQVVARVKQDSPFCPNLAATPEGDGMMLDNTLFLYGTGISDSNTHFHDDLPIALVGGKAAGLKGGRYVRHPKGTPLTNLHTTILEKMGVKVENLGDSTGRLTTISGDV